MSFKLSSLVLFLVANLFFPSLFAADIEKIANDDWLHLKSPNFEITTDLDEETGRYLIQDLENYRYFSIQRLGINLIADLKPLKVLAVSKESNFKNLNLSEKLAGVFSFGSYGYSAIANVKG